MSGDKYICVMDIGQFSSKIGWAGENEPRFTFFSVTGEPKYTQLSSNTDEKQTFVGNEVLDSVGLYKIHYPIQDGKIVDWTMYKELIDYVFYLMNVDPTQIYVLFITNPYFDTDTKRRLFKMFLEDYQVMGFYPVRNSLLTMYSGGFETGLIVDMGTAHITITPIFEGFILDHAVNYTNLGGFQLDKFMHKKLDEIGFNTETSSRKQIARLLKERGCFVSMDYETDLESSHDFKKEFALPDGEEIVIGKERFIIPELIFKPELGNLESPSLPELIVDSIQKCDIDIRMDLISNIFLTGGSSLFPNLKIRLAREIEKELVKLGKAYKEINIRAPQQRVFSGWIGGSILSHIPDFQSNWVTRKSYYERGIPKKLLDG